MVFIHGYQSLREAGDALAIEWARRGFVVLEIDAIGRGNSGVPPSEVNDPTFDPTFGGRAALTHLISLPYVNPEAVGKNRDINIRAVLEHELPVTTRVNTSAYYDVKQQAGACHSSQLSGPGSFFGRLPGWLVRRWQSVETFYRAVPSFQENERIERDLFAGIG